MHSKPPKLKRCIYCKACSATNTDLKFTREHVIHSALTPGFNNNLTLHSQVCGDCNHQLGNSIDQQFTRSGVEGMQRFQYGMKSVSRLNELDSSQVSVRAFGVASAVGPVQMVPNRNGENLTFEAVPQLLLEQQDGSWLSLTEKDFVDFDNLVDLNNSTGFVRFRAQTDQLENELKDKVIELLRARGISLTDMEPYIPGEENVLLEATADVTVLRSLSKIAFNYMAFVVEDVAEQLPFFHWFDMTRQFIRWNEFPKHAVVQYVGNLGLSALSGTFPAQPGHSLALGVLPWNDIEKRLVCLVSLFEKVVWAVNLSWTYRGPENCMFSGHHWNLTSREVESIAIDEQAFSEIRL